MLRSTVFTGAERTSRAWLRGQHGSRIAASSLCAWKESVIWSAHVSPFVALAPASYHEHIFFLVHSSFYHDTRTRTTSIAIKNHSGVKTSSVAETCATPSPQDEPKEFATKELATVWRILRATDPYQWNDAQKEFGEEDHRAPITEEVKEFGVIGTYGLPDSKIPETSYFQSHIHLDDSVGSIADSDLEDRVATDADITIVCPESFGEIRCIVFVWAGKPDQEFCV